MEARLSSQQLRQTGSTRTRLQRTPALPLSIKKRPPYGNSPVLPLRIVVPHREGTTLRARFGQRKAIVFESISIYMLLLCFNAYIYILFA